MIHIPVLLNEVIEALDPKPGKFIIDGTFGSGGHSAAILDKMMPTGKFLAMDWDKKNLDTNKDKIEAKFQIPNSKFQILWVHENYANLKEIIEEKGLGKADGLLIDLGFSSVQIEESGRGFSFLKDEPLDMRYNAGEEERGERREEEMETAAEIINSYTEKDLADIFYIYGEERFSRQIAKKIVEERRKEKILTTGKLAEITKAAVSRGYEKGRINPATRVFQALRIYVNKELENLNQVLENLPEILKPEGRAVIISFHSLEDRIVKNKFREIEKEGGGKILTKKPIAASREESLNNPRSRSAKLRAIRIMQN